MLRHLTRFHVTKREARTVLILWACSSKASHTAHWCHVLRSRFLRNSFSNRTSGITQSPPKNYDSKSRPTGDLRASLCSSTSRCGHGQPSTLYTRLTCVHSIGDTSFGASVISCMRQSSGSRPVINAIVPAAMLGARLDTGAARPRVLGFSCRIRVAIVRIANMIKASLLPSPSFSGNRQ